MSSSSPDVDLVLVPIPGSPTSDRKGLDKSQLSHYQSVLQQPMYYAGALMHDSESHCLNQNPNYNTLLSNDFDRNHLWQPYSQYHQQQQWLHFQQQQMWQLQHHQMLPFLQLQNQGVDFNSFYHSNHGNPYSTTNKPKDQCLNESTLKLLNDADIPMNPTPKEGFDSTGDVQLPIDDKDADPDESKIVRFVSLSHVDMPELDPSKSRLDETISGQNSEMSNPGVSVQLPTIIKRKRSSYSEAWRCQCINCINKKKNVLGSDRVHVCHIEGCDKSFKKTANLKAHLNWHSDTRPFACNCGKAFMRPDELHRHEKIHLGITTFHCRFCQKGFYRSDHLTKHEAIHTKVKPTKPRIRRQKREKSTNQGSNVTIVIFGQDSANANLRSHKEACDSNSSNVGSGYGTWEFMNSTSVAIDMNRL